MQKGVVLISKEVADRLLPKFSRLLAERQQSVEPVEYGSIEELKELVQHVANGVVSSKRDLFLTVYYFKV